MALDSWLPWKLAKQYSDAQYRMSVAEREARARLELVRMSKRKALESIHRIDGSGTLEQGHDPESARSVESAIDQSPTRDSISEARGK